MIINNKEYEINRENSVVTTWDKLYCETLKDIIKNGELCPNRTGIETLSIPNVYFKLDVGKEFPILETKKVAIKNTITELLWIYQAQSNKVSWLHERNNHIWDEWMVDADGIYRIYDPFKTYNDGNKVEAKTIYGDTIDKTKIGHKIYAESLKEDKSIKDAIYYGPSYSGTIGTAYGDVLKHTGEFDRVLKDLKENPRSRRMVVSLRQNNYLKGGVLEPCVWSTTYKLHKGKLNSNVNIRSNDMPLGNPFNVTQYSILLSLLSKINDFGVGEIVFNITDCHIYVNQLDGIKLQLSRYDRLIKWENYIKTHNDIDVEKSYKELIDRKEYIDNKLISCPYLKEDYENIINEIKEEIMCLEHLITRKNPSLYISDKKDFYAFDNKENNEDIKLLKYTSLPFIKMKVAQ